MTAGLIMPGHVSRHQHLKSCINAVLSPLLGPGAPLLRQNAKPVTLTWGKALLPTVAIHIKVGSVLSGSCSAP